MCCKCTFVHFTFCRLVSQIDFFPEAIILTCMHKLFCMSVVLIHVCHWLRFTYTLTVIGKVWCLHEKFSVVSVAHSTNCSGSYTSFDIFPLQEFFYLSFSSNDIINSGTPLHKGDRVEFYVATDKRYSWQILYSCCFTNLFL